MVKSAVTVSLVSEARGGPFVFWDNLQSAMFRAAELGFDAVEIFAPDARLVQRDQLAQWCEQTRLQVAAVGTGAGWVKHKLTLSDPSSDVRLQAIQFVKDMIDFGAEFNAPAIIGSMQGRAPSSAEREQTLSVLAESLKTLAEHAAGKSVPLIYEPLNRYETNLCNTMDQGTEFLQQYQLENVVLLADLFHMNIEEVSIADALRHNAESIGHIHFVDSNRRAAGLGHIEFSPIAQALKDSGYRGYLSAEALSLPDADSAARQTMQAFRELF